MGRKKFILLTLPYLYSASKAVRTGTQAEQELAAGDDVDGYGGVLFAGLLLDAWLSLCSYSTQGQQQHNGLGPSPSLIKKIPYRILWKQFLNRGFLPSDDYHLCQVGIKLASTETKRKKKGKGKISVNGEDRRKGVRE